MISGKNAAKVKEEGNSFFVLFAEKVSAVIASTASFASTG